MFASLKQHILVLSSGKQTSDSTCTCSYESWPFAAAFSTLDILVSDILPLLNPSPATKNASENVVFRSRLTYAALKSP